SAPSTRREAGEAVPFMQGVDSTSFNGSSQFALSASGAATYLAGSGAAGLKLHMSTRNNVEELGGASPDLHPGVSPDGQTIALEDGGAQYDVHLLEWARNRSTRLTFEPTQD